jgi:hypothetical protein
MKKRCHNKGIDLDSKGMFKLTLWTEHSGIQNREEIMENKNLESRQQLIGLLRVRKCPRNRMN